MLSLLYHIGIFVILFAVNADYIAEGPTDIITVQHKNCTFSCVPKFTTSRKFQWVFLNMNGTSHVLHEHDHEESVPSTLLGSGEDRYNKFNSDSRSSSSRSNNNRVGLSARTGYSSRGFSSYGSNKGSSRGGSSNQKGSRQSTPKQSSKNANKYKFTTVTTEDGDTKFLLKVVNVSLEDAGKYTCKFVNPNSEDSIKSASLVVMTSVTPKVNDAYLAGSVLMANCSISYESLDTINAESVPQCSAYFHEEPMELNETLSDEPGHIEYVYTFEVYENHTGLNFKCDANITDSADVYSNSTEVTVMWPVHGVEITPKNLYFDVGSEVTCSAAGNPQPVHFRWISCKGHVTYGPVLTIWSFMEYEEQTWICEALNVINDIPYSAYTTFSFISEGGYPTTVDYSSENYTGQHMSYDCYFGTCFWSSSSYTANASLYVLLTNIIMFFFIGYCPIL